MSFYEHGRPRRLGPIAALAASLFIHSFAMAAEPLWPDLSEPASRRGGGEGDAAVVVGIEDYVSLPAVPGATDNARDWYLWFTETRKTPVERIHLLRDQEATREGILDELERVADQADEHGTIWFVFIGHGAPSSGGEDGLLLGWDTQQTARSVFARGITQSEVLDVLDQHPRSVAILDACFSGRASSGEALVEGLQPVVPEYAVDPESTTVLTAAENDQFAGPLPGALRPAFSYLVLGALRGWGDADGNGRITGAEAMGYVSKAMVTAVKDRSQTPVGYGPDLGLTLTKGKERGPDLSRIVLEAESQQDARSSWGPGESVAVGRGDSSAEPDPTTHTSPAASRSDGLERIIGAQENVARLTGQAKADFDRIMSIPSASRRKVALEAFVDEYAITNDGDIDDLYAPQIPEVGRARLALDRYGRRVFLGGHGMISGVFAEGSGWQSYYACANGYFVLGFPFTRGSDSSFIVQAGMGGQFKEVSASELRQAYAEIALGVGQFLATRNNRGNRVGLWLGEGVGIGLGDSNGSIPELDFQVMFAMHWIRGFFIAFGGRFRGALSSNSPPFIPGLAVRIGSMEFLP